MFRSIGDLIARLLRGSTQLPLDESDLNRLYHLQEMQKHHLQEMPRHCGHDVWTLAHSEQERVHTRLIKDAAVNHWFVCDKGVCQFANSKPVTYDPYLKLLTELQYDIPIETMERIWDNAPAKNQQVDELRDFEQIWLRDSILRKLSRQDFVAVYLQDHPNLERIISNQPLLISQDTPGRDEEKGLIQAATARQPTVELHC